MLFGTLGVGLVLLGWWGRRNGDELSKAPKWDEKYAERRRRVLRRGSFTCLGVGLFFVVLAVVSLFVPPPPPPR